MFTGLIQGLGKVCEVTSHHQGMLLDVNVDSMSKSLSVGDSLSLNGVCSTVKTILGETVSIEYLSETLRKTAIGELSSGDSVNLELAMTPSTRMGGHMVQGHVDIVGHVLSFEMKEPWSVVTISFPDFFAKYVVEKGSIAVDGVSLTLVDVKETQFSCHLISHTVQNTIFSRYKKGTLVNLEFDIVGKYLYKFYTQAYENFKK